MEIQQLYEIFKKYPYITIDIQDVKNDSLFFCIKEGNKYAKKAIESGCRYAFVDKPEYADAENNIILVEDTLIALQNLASYHRRRFKIPIIAITGSTGKTITKELIETVLSQEYNVLSTNSNIQDYNTEVPLTLLRISKEHEIGVIEIGANNVGDIQQLAVIVDPNYGLITHIDASHLNKFGSFENLRRSKGELYEYLKYRKEGKIFLNNDDEVLKSLAQGGTSIEYGTSKGLFVTGEMISDYPYLTFKWKFSMRPHTVHTHIFGEHNFPNFLAAITVGKYFGVKSSFVCKALEKYIPLNSTFRTTEMIQSDSLILDTYNNTVKTIVPYTQFSGLKIKNTDNDMRSYN